VEKPLKFSQFGSDNGRIVVYFHGAPGAPEECRTFDLEGKNHGLTFICFDRFSADATLHGEAYYKRLAEEISRISSGKPVDVVGFSIGAFIALQTIRHMTHGVRSLHLVSAAAPLESGDYLEAMAGKQVFKLAKAAPALFVLLSYWQGLLAWLAPNALFRLLFASAAGADITLAADHQFRAGITQVLKACFMGKVRGYARDIGLYLQPWEATLAEVSAHTYIWHGAEDNWSPPQMAEHLKSAIPGCNSSTLFNGLSHYSCLHQAAREICQLSGKA
jgi:pimeloyl-ACP methyl ester carboxylesterase